MAGELCKKLGSILCANNKLVDVIVIRNGEFHSQGYNPSNQYRSPSTFWQIPVLQGLVRSVVPISELPASSGSHVLFGDVNCDQQDKEEQYNLGIDVRT